tara:strand:+ start:3994 stop:4410 length:417 start_codon:yes stop_codon:yes gene_type:complete
MLWNLTYADPDRWQEVYAISGKPLPWWKRAGSPRMRLLEGPGPVSDMIEETSNVKWANLQRTQSGAILYFRVRLEVYGMPCASAQTHWQIHASEGQRELHLHHAQGLVRLGLSSTPSKGFLALLNAAFGPETVSKVHM